MFTIKRFKPSELIKRIELGNGKTVEVRAKRYETSYVVMKDGEPYSTPNLLTGKPELKSYKQKSTAQQCADYFNRQNA
jgi:hypothetical protein